MIDIETYRDPLTQAGFFVTPPIFPQSALAWIDTALDRAVAASLDMPAPHGVAIAERDGWRYVTGISRIYEHLGAVALYLTGHPTLVELARLACGEDAVPTHDWMVLKNAGDGHAVGWHRDFAHEGRHTVINIGIHLDAAAEDAVCFIPGSHRDRLSVGELAGHYRYDSPTVVRAEVARGGLSVHNVLTVHGSPALLRQHRRRTLYIEYRSAACANLPPAYLAQRQRLQRAAQLRYRQLGSAAVGSPPPLNAEEGEILRALDALQVRIEPANYG